MNYDHAKIGVEKVVDSQVPMQGMSNVMPGGRHHMMSGMSEGDGHNMQFSKEGGRTYVGTKSKTIMAK